MKPDRQARERLLNQSKTGSVDLIEKLAESVVDLIGIGRLEIPSGRGALLQRW